MKTLLLLSASTLAFTSLVCADPAPAPSSNPLIDYTGFQKIVVDTRAQWAQRLLSEDQFMKMMAEPGVVVLDARTANRYAQRHILGATSLPFTDFTANSLAHVLPSKQTKVLIYCNNNFLGDQAAFTSKMPTASLNLSTYTSLISYGYTNVYQLAPLLDVSTTKIPFAGTETQPKAVSLQLQPTPIDLQAISAQNSDLDPQPCD